LPRWTALFSAAALTLAGAALVAPGSARADSTRFVTFDARTVGAIFDFSQLVPDIVPVEITGGVLASSAQARQGPKAFGTAGMAPIPILTSLGLIIPQKDPVAHQPIPQQFQDAAHSIDYTKMPGYCQAAFPTSSGTSTNAECGGPSQDNGDLGFTADGAEGRVSARANPDDDSSAVTSSNSRGASASITALAASLRNYDAESSSALNADGVPEAISRATADGVSLLGNTVRIDGIHSETDLAYDGTPNGVAGRSSFSVASASIFGVPIVIDQNGFSAASSNGGDPKSTQDLIAHLNDAMRVQDFTMRLFPATPLKKNGTEVTVGSAGIEFSYRTDAVHYDGRIGYTQASVVAVPKLQQGLTDAAPAAPTANTSAANAAPAPAAPVALATAAQRPAAAERGTDNVVPPSQPTGSAVAPAPVTTEQNSAGPPTVNVQIVGDQQKLTHLATMAYARPSADRVAELYIALGGFLALIAVLCCLRSVNLAGRLMGILAGVRRAMSR
jgi:pyruvate/2-oxoglutarate dehydrogenase complex dihydrolipoamide acyltransferase (E2) component